MQALLGNRPAVDFETNDFNESLDVVLYHIKPLRHMPAVILEQEFLDRMVNGIKPLQALVNTIGEYSFVTLFLLFCSFVVNYIEALIILLCGGSHYRRQGQMIVFL